jgi:acetyltransferase-like isoleucine patch superfamily enzyme
MSAIGQVCDSLLLWFVQDMPGAPGRRLRRWYWGKRLKHLGKGAIIDCGVYLQGAAHISIGDNTWIDRRVIILAGPSRAGRATRRVGEAPANADGEVAIGANVHIAPDVLVSGIDAGVSIGDNSNIAASSKLYAYSHHFRFDARKWDRECYFGPMVEPQFQSMVSGPIRLGRNVGVAVNCVLLPGVTVEADCFVLPNSVLPAGTYEANSLIAGNPAKRVAARFAEPDATHA